VTVISTWASHRPLFPEDRHAAVVRFVMCAREAAADSIVIVPVSVSFTISDLDRRAACGL
jgi:hypothetical protein